MRILIDTNVLVSAFVFGGKAGTLMNMLFESSHELLVSDYVDAEFKAILEMKWKEKAEKVYSLYHKLPFVFCGSSPIPMGNLRDAKDIPVLSDALFHHADMILSADNDFSLGQFNLFLCYIKGEGTQKDLNKAIHYLQRSANQGYWRAELFLGLLLFEGVGVVADREKAVYWLEKAANQGATDAMYLLGTLYLDGEPDEREYSKALYWIRQAAYYGMPEAQYHYGCLFKEGVLEEPDMDKYFRWINRADHNGYYYARYGEYYAGRYLLALTQSREPVSDKTYLLQALEEQDINSEGKALYQEGFNSMFGPTLGKNNPGAIKCLIRSTLKGNQSAKILLAYCFATATGTLLESATAAQLFVGKGRIKYKDESGYTTIDFEIFEDGSCNKSMDWHRD